MAEYLYKARTPEGENTEGSIEASSLDAAVAALQARSFLVTSIEPTETKAGGGLGFLQSLFGGMGKVKTVDVVVLTRQLSTLFEAKVPLVESIKILASETQSLALRRHLIEFLDDIKGGMSMSQAMARQPEVFSKFYIAMVRSGEEAGKLEKIFKFLADYLERTMDLTRKARNALIYPAFVFSVFIIVMVFMLVFVFPRLTVILTETGQELPIYTKIIIGLSSFLQNYGLVLLVFLAGLVAFLIRYAKTETGKLYFSRVSISAPIVGNLYRKIYLSRIADNLYTLLSGGITIIRALEITAEVVGNEIYRRILLDTLESVKGGSMMSEALSRYNDFPPLFSQMLRVGEATGKLGFILKNVATFYGKEVDNLVDNLVTLIEPILIVFLALGVAVLVFSVMVPIYNISSSF